MAERQKIKLNRKYQGNDLITTLEPAKDEHSWEY